MKSVPFHSQIVNWNNENSGFPDQLAIDKWEGNCCGIACLRMVLDFYGVSGGTTYWDLLRLGLERGAYSEKGWIHQGLQDMAALFGVRGRCHRRTRIEDVMTAIEQNSICIVSITKYFLGGQRDREGTILEPGGHLVVAYDTARDERGVYGVVCNHPSSSPSWNMPAWAVETEKWRRSFAGNFIEFYSGGVTPGTFE